MKKQLIILLIILLPKLQLVCQTYVYSSEELNAINHDVEHLGISYKITMEDFRSKSFDHIKSIRVNTTKFESSQILCFMPNLNSLIIESNKINYFDWKDLPSGITSLKLGSVPKKMKHFDHSYLPKNLKKIHLRGKWDNHQLQSLLDANTHLEELILENIRINKFAITNKTINYLGLIKMDLTKEIVLNDIPSLKKLFINECKSLDMRFILRMEKVAEITIQGSEIKNHYFINSAVFLKELTIRNSEFKSDVISISNNSLLKLRLTNNTPREVTLNTPALKQLDLTNNKKAALNGLEQFSNQLTHFYCYETALTNVNLVNYDFQSLKFFGGLDNVNRKTLPKDYIEYGCPTCTGSMRRVPNDW